LIVLALAAASACGTGAGSADSTATSSVPESAECAALAAHYRPLAEREADKAPIRMRGLANSTPLAIGGDLVALDGTRALYFDDRGLEVMDTAHGRLTAVGRLTLKNGGDRILVLPNHRVVVTGGYGEYPAGESMPISHAVISEIDLGDPAHPRLLDTEDVTGRVMGASAVDGVARVVVTSTPQFISRYPRGDETDAQVQQRNQRVAHAARGEDYLPHRRITDATGTLIADGPLLGCADLAQPNAPRALGTTTVLTVDPSATEPAPAHGVADVADYLADAGERIVLGTFDRHGANARTTSSTTIYSLDGGAGSVGRLVAAGTVPGDVAGDEAISVDHGLVRVVLGVSPSLAYPPGKTASRRGLAILREQDGRLQLVGHVSTGSGDLVKRVSWIGDLAVFEDSKGTDYIVDTSRPEAPRLTAAVKLPGHLGLVQNSSQQRTFAVGPDEGGSTLKTSTTVGFLDLTDPAKPRVTGSISLGRGASGLEGTSRALGWFPDLNLAVVPLRTTELVGPPQCPLLKGRPSCATDVPHAVLIRLGANHSLHVLGTVTLHGYQRRFVQVGDLVLAITDESVILIDPRKAVVLDEVRHSIHKSAG